MFVRIETTDGLIDVSPEMANELIERKIIFQCRDCGNCHPEPGVSHEFIREKLEAVIN